MRNAHRQHRYLVGHGAPELEAIRCHPIGHGRGKQPTTGRLAIEPANLNGRWLSLERRAGMNPRSQLTPLENAVSTLTARQTLRIEVLEQWDQELARRSQAIA